MKIAIKSALLAATLVCSTAAVSFGADLCDGIDKDFIVKHVPFNVEKIIDKKPLPEYDICMVLVGVQNNTGPVFVTKGRKAVIAGEIFKDKQAISRPLAGAAAQQDVVVSDKEMNDAVAFTYKPAGQVKAHVYFVTDPDCPYCEKAKDPVRRFADENGVEVRVVFFPLPMHREARDKSIKAICGKMDYAGYQASQWYKAEYCKEGEDKVNRAMEVVRKMGINGTPTFVAANGTKVSGFSPEQLKGILQ